MILPTTARSFLLIIRRCVIALLLAVGFNAGAGQAQVIQTTRGSGVSIEISNAFEDLPTRGYSPLRITIGNQSGATRTWRFDATASQSYGQGAQTSWSAAFTVDHQDVREFDVLVPMPTSEHAMYPRLNIRVSGYGTHNGSTFNQSSQYHYGGGSSHIPFIAMSQEFASPNKSRLEEHYTSRSDPLNAAVFRPDDHRAEAMAYAGLDIFWITPREWRALPQRNIQAITQWINLGGLLVLAANPDDSLENLPGLPATLSPSRTPLGFGAVVTTTTKNGLVAPDTFQRISKREMLGPASHDHATKIGQWLGRLGLNESNRPKAFILTLVIAFAVLIGPVNLWMAHKKKRPAAVLWVTPILSVGCSIAMALLIVIKDGFGGRGIRSAVAFIQPDTATMAVVQEQASKTGVLVAPVFTLPPSALIETRFSGGEIFPQVSQSFRNNQVSGGTFSSRATQTHLIERIEPTRSRIEIFTAADGSVTALSSINARLDTLYYHDPDGQWWRAVDIGTGERKPMESVPASEFLAAQKAFTEKAGPEVALRLSQIKATENLFFGFTTSGAEIMTDTLAAINWEQDHALWIGPATRAGGTR